MEITALCLPTAHMCKLRDAKHSEKLSRQIIYVKHQQILIYLNFRQNIKDKSSSKNQYSSNVNRVFSGPTMPLSMLGQKDDTAMRKLRSK